MALPDLSVSFRNSRGLNRQSVDPRRIMIVGTSTAGTANMIYNIGAIQNVVSNVGYGPGPDAVAMALRNGASNVLFYKSAGKASTGKLGTVTKVGGGASPTPTIAGASTVDTYQMRVDIVLGGALNAAKCTISMDNGRKTYGPVLIPTGGVVALSTANGLPYDTGATLTFGAGTYVVGDYYLCDIYGLAPDETAAATVATNIIASGYEFDFLHIVGCNQGGANDSTNMGSGNKTYIDAWAAIGTTLQASYLYPTICMDHPQPLARAYSTAGTEAGYLAAAGRPADNDRLFVGAYHYLVPSPLTGWTQYRCATWLAIEERAMINSDISESLGAVARGSLSNTVSSTFADGTGTGDDRYLGAAALYNSGYASGRTFRSKSGWYLSGSPMMTSSTSDYAFLELRRVVDLAAYYANQIGLNLVNSKVRTKANGTIAEVDATAIEQSIAQAVKDQMLTKNWIQDAVATVDRTTNIQSTGLLKIQLLIQAFGYARTVSLEYGLLAPTV